MNMHVLQNTLKQRNEWRTEFKLKDAELFEIFSEFSAMMVINRQKINQNKSTSMKNKVEQMQKNNKDYLSELFPIVDGTSSRKYNAMKEEEAHLHNKLKKNDLVDFKVPAWICMQNAEALKSTKVKPRP